MGLGFTGWPHGFPFHIWSAPDRFDLCLSGHFRVLGRGVPFLHRILAFFYRPSFQVTAVDGRNTSPVDID